MNRPEPRSMTLVDLVALVLGVALGLVAIPERGVISYLATPPPEVLIFLGLLMLSQGWAVAVAVVVFGRSAVYRRMPSPAEWLAVLVAASALSAWPVFNPDGWVNAVYAAFPSTRDSSIGFGGLRWILSGAEAALIASGLVLSWLGRRRLPRWSLSLILTMLASATIAGPLFVVGLQGGELLAPSAGFGPGVGSTLHHRACELAAQIPLGLLFGVPAVATLADRLGGRRWSWVDRAALIAALLVGLLAAFTYRNEFSEVSWPWLAERLMLLAWFVVVALLGRLILRAWRRWDRVREPAPVQIEN